MPYVVRLAPPMQIILIDRTGARLRPDPVHLDQTEMDWMA